jgi:hypothetical protein
MEYLTRQYPLFSACGLNCGLCPRFHTDGKSRCPGCGADDFSLNRPSCGALSCCRRKGVEYCCQCREYPCVKYNGADEADSFITHKNQFRDMKKAAAYGIDAYAAELEQKIMILRDLLDNYNDGRQKSMFCIAVNLFELKDLKETSAEIKRSVVIHKPIAERAAVASRVIKAAAKKLDVTLTLRKRKG